MPNLNIIRKLPQANRNLGGFAKIYRLDGKSVWEFLYMPTEISYQKRANYSASGAPGFTQHLQFVNTDNETLNINNLPINTVWQDKKLQEYVKELGDLTEADPIALSPPVLGFSWNARRFIPCVLEDFSVTEKSWFPSGDLSACTISFTLKKIPQNQIVQI